MELPDHLDPSLIRRIIDLGQHPDLESPTVLDSFEDLRSCDWINRLHWSIWNNAVKSLTAQEMVALVKALSTMEDRWCWAGGSVAAAIWVLQDLGKRDSTSAEFVRQWLRAHSKNPYL